jgi:hypothetical protein
VVLEGIQTSAVAQGDQHRDPAMDHRARMDMQTLDTIIEGTARYHLYETILPLLLEA